MDTLNGRTGEHGAGGGGHAAYHAGRRASAARSRRRGCCWRAGRGRRFHGYAAPWRRWRSGQQCARAWGSSARQRAVGGCCRQGCCRRLPRQARAPGMAVAVAQHWARAASASAPRAPNAERRQRFPTRGPRLLPSGGDNARVRVRRAPRGCAVRLMSGADGVVSRGRARARHRRVEARLAPRAEARRAVVV